MRDLLIQIRDSFREVAPERRASPENPSTSLSDPAGWLWDAFGASGSGSGIAVSEESAMRLTPVFAAIRILSETVASLPCFVYKRTPDGGKERADGHDAFPVLHDEFNPFMSSFTGRELMQSHAAGRGNGYALIERDGSGYIKALWPAPADCMDPQIIGGKLYYRITNSGTNLLGIKPGVYQPESVLHVPGLSYDGVHGYSPIRLAREAIGLGLAAEQYGARFFGNGARAGGFLSTEQALPKEQQERLRDSWNSVHEGVYKSHKIAILGGGLKWNSMSISQEDAQFLETRKFQVAEVARLFRVPLALLDEHDKAATYASVEQFMLSFVIHTIRPWLVRWEQEINRKLFTPKERFKYFAQFSIDGMLRGDIKSRYDAYQVAKTNGWMTADEIRSLENMNPVPDGQGGEFYRPLNLGLVSDDGKPPAPSGVVQ